ncbi:hypothetical protein ACWD25_54565, partial [Streptomyces sp. NPDC002920]
ADCRLPTADCRPGWSALYWADLSSEASAVGMSPLHQIAIPNMGLPLGEMWDLEALAEDCAADGVYEFLLVAAPLPVTGAVGAPVNPIAMK